MATSNDQAMDPHAEANSPTARAEPEVDASSKDMVVYASPAPVIWRALVRAIKTGGGAWGLRAVIGFATGVFSRRRRAAGLIRLLRETTTAPDALRFGLFVGSFVGTYDAIASLLRWARGTDDSVNRTLATVGASLAFFLDEPTQRGSMALYVAIRAGYIVARRGVRLGVLPECKWAPYALFSLVNGPIMWAAFLAPQHLEKSYYHWMLNISNMTHVGLDTAIRSRRNAIADGADGSLIPLPSCSSGYHTGPCTTAHVVDVFHGFGRASLMYIPVHLMPTLIFGGRALVASPQTSLWRLAVSIARSSLFLSLYQTMFKSIVCLSRWTLGADTDAAIFAGGMATAGALMVENPKRATELTLYCAHKSLWVVWSWALARGLVVPVPRGDWALFAAAMVVCMTADGRDLQSTIAGARKTLFGSVSFPTQQPPEAAKTNAPTNAPTSHDDFK